MDKTENIKYAAEIKDVKEVVISGEADFEFWKKLLEPKGYLPSEKNGKAQIIVSATELEWKGIRFNEFIINIVISPQIKGQKRDCFYLIQAFNSSSILALSERLFFSTPYNFGKIILRNEFPVLLRLILKEKELFHCKINSKYSESIPSMEKHSIFVFLPNGTRHKKKYFIAYISGETIFFPFEKEQDILKIVTSVKYPVFGWLIDSKFIARDVVIRKNALHKKSKTMIL